MLTGSVAQLPPVDIASPVRRARRAERRGAGLLRFEDVADSALVLLLLLLIITITITITITIG